jgi:hypothetical protein
MKAAVVTAFDQPLKILDEVNAAIEDVLASRVEARLVFEF